MGSKIKLSAVLAALAAVGAAQPAHADGKAWRVDLEAGILYDSNVDNDENDSSSSIGDSAVTFEIDAAYKLVNSEHSRIELGYNFFQSLYQDLSAFNYQTHKPELSAWTKLGTVKLGVAYMYSNAQYDGAFFQQQHVFTPSISGMLTDNIHFKATYRYVDKNYNVADNGRDAQTQQPAGDLQFYFDKANKGYVSLGGTYTIEDASDLAYDYDGLTGRAAVQFPIAVFGKGGRLKVSYAYLMRDYDDITSTSIGEKREDRRHTFRAQGEVEVTANLTAIAEYRFVDRNSNLASANYSESIASGALRYGF